MSEWVITSWALKHPVHGSFTISHQSAIGAYTAQRSWRARQDAAVECEYVGHFAAFKTLDEAKAATEARIVEMDAELARKMTATPLCCSSATDATSSATEGL